VNDSDSVICLVCVAGRVEMATLAIDWTFCFQVFRRGMNVMDFFILDICYYVFLINSFFGYGVLIDLRALKESLMMMLGLFEVEAEITFSVW